MGRSSRSPGLRSQASPRFLRCSSRMPPWPCTIAFGSPVVPLTRTARRAGGRTAPARRRARRPRRPLGRDRRARASAARRGSPRPPRARSIALAAVHVAVDREQHLRLDLREAVDHAARAELGRDAGPDRAEAGGGQERDERLGDVRAGRRRRGRPSRRRAAAARRARRATCSRSSLNVSSNGSRVCERATTATLVAVVQHVLGVVERRAREPLGAGHLPRAEHALGVALELVEVRDRLPEPSRSVTDQRCSAS